MELSILRLLGVNKDVSPSQHYSILPLWKHQHASGRTPCRGLLSTSPKNCLWSYWQCDTSINACWIYALYLLENVKWLFGGILIDPILNPKEDHMVNGTSSWSSSMSVDEYENLSSETIEIKELDFSLYRAMASKPYTSWDTGLLR